MEQSFIKACWYTLIGWFSQMVFYFTPIHGLIVGLTIAFFVSFAFGILAGVLKQNEAVNLKKASRAFTELATYFVIIAALFIIGDKMEDGGWVADILSAITWGMIYFYVANWTKNMKRLFPSSRGIRFLNFVLGLEFLKRVPYLKDFVEQEDKEKEDQKNEKISSDN